MLPLLADATSLQEAFAINSLGQAALTASLVLALVLVGITVTGIARRDTRLIEAARVGQYGLLSLIALACGVLLLMIFEGMFVSAYVARVTEVSETFFFKLSALWASQEGSLLFWCLILSLCGAAFARSHRNNFADRRIPWSLLALFLIEAFFLFMFVFDRSNPFTLQWQWLGNDELAHLTAGQAIQLWQQGGTFFEYLGTGANELLGTLAGYSFDETTGALLGTDRPPTGTVSALPLGDVFNLMRDNPAALPAETLKYLLFASADGAGMNPQLHNYWIAIHPPTLYLGYIGFTIPFCYCIGALASGELGNEWLRRARVWVMVSWALLTAGIAMGGLWAYEILGWGGYWAWDPVENASFIPWLFATAFIHSALVQERRGLLKVWNAVLIIATYCMTIIGTFLVRSGIIESVHAFGETGLKVPLLAFFCVIVVGSLLLIVYRWRMLRTRARLESLLSREGFFLLNNLLLVAIAVITLTMTLWPAITEFLRGTGGRYQFREDPYTLVNAPLFLLLMVATGMGPLLRWGPVTMAALWQRMKRPVIAAALVTIGNVIFLSVFDLWRSVPEGATRLASAVEMVRIAMQTLQPGVCALIAASVFVELNESVQGRRRNQGGSWLRHAIDAALADNRRFGGYTAHIGLGMVALGIMISSFHDVDTSAEIPRGGYEVFDDRWVLVYDRHEESSLFRLLKQAESDSGEGGERARLRLNALTQFRNDPSLKAGELIESLRTRAPAIANDPQALARMTDVFTWAESTARQRMPAFEEYASSVRVVPYNAPDLSKDEQQAFLQHYRTAFEAWHASEQRTLSEAAGNAELRSSLFTLGPAGLSLMQGLVQQESGLIDEHREFQRQLRMELFLQERFRVFELVTRISENDASLAAQARADLTALGWRAIGGLRYCESQSDAVREIAQTELRRLLAGVDTLRPRIQTFYNKRTGELRPAGEAVRDPEIQKYLLEDVYVILQDLAFSGGASPRDSAVFRVFIKPAMNLGLLGLVTILAGAFFALLPLTRPVRNEGQKPNPPAKQQPELKEEV